MIPCPNILVDGRYLRPGDVLHGNDDGYHWRVDRKPGRWVWTLVKSPRADRPLGSVWTLDDDDAKDMPWDTITRVKA